MPEGIFSIDSIQENDFKSSAMDDVIWLEFYTENLEIGELFCEQGKSK